MSFYTILNIKTIEYVKSLIKNNVVLKKADHQ
jgi:hypothetical protein